MLIRSKSYNALVDFNGNGIFWHGGDICCACGGMSIKIKSTSDFQESSKVIDTIQEAFLRGEEIVTIE